MSVETFVGLGYERAIDTALAERAIRDVVADPCGMSLEETAHGVHLIANSNMVRAIKSASVERGRDPVDFVLMAFRGAGPLHACGVATSLGIRTVLVPPAHHEITPLSVREQIGRAATVICP